MVCGSFSSDLPSLYSLYCTSLLIHGKALGKRARRGCVIIIMNIMRLISLLSSYMFSIRILNNYNHFCVGILNLP